MLCTGVQSDSARFTILKLFWYCRDCPGFEQGITGFVALCSTTEPLQLLMSHHNTTTEPNFFKNPFIQGFKLSLLWEIYEKQIKN